MSGRHHNRFPDWDTPERKEANRYWVECRTLGKTEADRRAKKRAAAPKACASTPEKGEA